ncbi:MAG: ComEA family DNA-binding protein [Bacteroidota bacterium]|jgi:competence protein ComEA
MIRTFLSSLTKSERYERIGYAALLVALLLAFGLRYLLALQTSPPVVLEESLSPDYNIEEKPFGKSPLMFHSGRNASSKGKHYKIPQGPVHVNKLTRDDWMDMGFTPAQAAVITRFRNALGGFSSLQQMKKCFVLDETFLELGRDRFVYDALSPSHSKPQKDSIRANAGDVSASLIPKPRVIDLNSADTAILQSLKGVGPYWAKRIFRYKEKLGGFLHPSQLLEIEGMDSLLFQSISPSVVVDTSFVYRIPINRVSAYKLQQHPYFGKNLAVALVNYRERHGPFRSPGQLRHCLLVDHQIFRKIVPYLSFSE